MSTNPGRWADMDESAQRDVLEWVVHTVIIQGSRLSTAYQVAALFAEGLDREVDHVPPTPLTYRRS